MGSSPEICHQEEEKIVDSVTKKLRESFQFLTIILLSLLLPLSFIVLARLSVARYLIATSTYAEPDSLLVTIFLYGNPTPLHVLAPLISIAALIHGLSGRTIFSFKQFSSSDQVVSKPCLHTAWFFLCLFQICVCIGIEGSIAIGIDGSGFSKERCLISRAIFFLGLHDTMLFWSKKVVKPVVDDTVFGVAREEKWAEKLVMAMSFGALWWLKLRDEVESLVVVAEMKRDLMGVGLVDFVGWWLYYVTVCIGMVKVVKALIWLCSVLFCGDIVVDSDNAGYCRRNDDKV